MTAVKFSPSWFGERMKDHQAIAILAALLAGQGGDPRTKLADAFDLLNHAKRLTELAADEPSSKTDVDWDDDCEFPF